MKSIQLPFKALTYIMMPVIVLISMTYSGCIEEDDGTPPALNLPVMSISDLTVQEGDVDQVIQLTVTLTGENTTNAIVTFVL